MTCGAGALTREMGGADLPVRAHLALEQRHYELAALQRYVQIGRHAQQYETSDVIARRYIGVDHQPLAAQFSYRRGLNRSVRSQRRKVMKTASLLSMALVAGLCISESRRQGNLPQIERIDHRRQAGDLRPRRHCSSFL